MVPALQGVPDRSNRMLYPIQNETRNLLDLSGVWDFQPDFKELGVQNGWFNRLDKPRPIAVPGSWNELFLDLFDYLGTCWYARSVQLPSAWQGQRVLLRIGSANYAAKVWVNGTLAGQHLGGHVPFEMDITHLVAWDQKNNITISVENLQLPERLPAGPSLTNGLFDGMNSSYTQTTYDYFPFAGLHRPVILHSVPPVHITDITTATYIDRKDGMIQLKVAADGYSGRGKARFAEFGADLEFHEGIAETTLRIPDAHFWTPEDPHLYPVTIMLGEINNVLDVYTLDIGIRTIKIRGGELLLNGQPLKLTGFGKHEDFPIHGRGLDIPLLIRDFDLIHWCGANTYRTAHYPHSEEEMLLADRLGVLIIDEISITELNFADSVELTARRLEQGKRQLDEMINRDKNHPSVILWCIGNEPMVGNPLSPPSPLQAASIEAGSRFFGDLYHQARSTDPTRPVLLVGVQGGPTEWFNQCDAIGVNRYYGWYTQQGRLDQAVKVLEGELDTLFQSFGKPILMTEFGTETLAGAHSTQSEMWTEEYQVDFLRRYLDTAAARPFIAGTLVWAFADFKTGQSIGRVEGQNHKGIFTRDRKPKMAAHFLHARWTKK